MCLYYLLDIEFYTYLLVSHLNVLFRPFISLLIFGSLNPSILECCFKITIQDFPGGTVLGVRLPMQGTWVQALVRDDPTCHRATKPMRHNYWACTVELASHNYWTRVPLLLKPTRLGPVLCNGRGHRGERPAHGSKEWPPLATTRESPHTATKTQRSQK